MSMLSEVQSRLSVLVSTFLEGNDFLASDVTCCVLCNKLFDALHQGKSYKNIYLSASEARGYLWEALHSKSWDDIGVGYRDAFGLITLIAATAYHHENFLLDGHIVHESQLTALIDSGILLGSRRYHDELFLLVDEAAGLKIATGTRSSKKGAEVSVHSDFGVKKDINRSTLPSFLSRKRAKSARSTAITRKTAPSLVDFYNECLLVGTPAVLTGCMEDWSAMEKWRSLDYYRKVAGSRTVPVEIGSSYLSEDYNQQLMSVDKFISTFITCLTQEHTQGTGYLAQHRLFDQVPLLLKDIATPDYCALLTEEDEVAEADVSLTGNSENVVEGADAVIVNAWLGPSTTVSPLHHDPYHNLLAQVVGYKYVRLYHPSASQFLYPMSDRMSNNSKMDLSAPGEDRDRFPLSVAKECRFSETILCPGEMLFIPRWHWHFVAAISEVFALQWMEERTEDSSQNDGKDDLESRRSPLERGHGKRRKCSSVGECEPSFPLSIDRNAPSEPSSAEPEFSSSVSFWWGRRILKK